MSHSILQELYVSFKLMVFVKKTARNTERAKTKLKAGRNKVHVNEFFVPWQLMHQGHPPSRWI